MDAKGGESVYDREGLQHLGQLMLVEVRYV